MLEAGEHAFNSYVTLTLDEEHNPGGRSCVSVYESQLFLKRLRSIIGPFRYFIVGEYGEKSWRAHYHALLFGVRDGCGVSEAWTKGRVHISGVGPESVGYVAGYCLKGALNASGMRYHGKGELCPEFARMSLRPGLGARAADRIGGFFTTASGSKAIARESGVPGVLRQAGRKWKMGRYLSSRAAQAAGLSQEDVSRIRQLESAFELQGMDQLALNELLQLRESQSERSGVRARERVLLQSFERRL